ncbi:MAG: thioesterase family protein [Sphingomonadaceae bacterium]|uniref:acyl-CoA thioesterase n=1 Tax=Thermaurantiacus sp. TaxID=2820283 RepID=UPI00298F2780|nr:acyl-CoA thioesterase domain-containing protein [Thermaurantiacus sp.]MCS6986985.1 thioesterase family protein [Sphingomonadaceae bacterium]MDW8415414.1 thioesterase family protein [Thermaurantiacus sp.]
MAVVEPWDGRSVPELLELERLDLNLFRNRRNQANANRALFGGQVLAQALAAATVTAPEDRSVHSLHGYFLRAGQADRAVIYQVERTRDGGRFSTRRVTAIQEGEPIFHMELGFHTGEEGFAHQRDIPEGMPGPEELLDLAGLAERLGDRLPEFLRRRFLGGARPVEVRPVDPIAFLDGRGREPRRRFWVRMPSAEGAGPRDQPALLTYVSDYWLAGTAVLPHAAPLPSAGIFLASLDHAMWFHHPSCVSDWLLFETVSPVARAGRGLSLGFVHDRAGTLVATMVQEALIRPRRPTPA